MKTLKQTSSTAISLSWLPQSGWLITLLAEMKLPVGHNDDLIDNMTMVTIMTMITMMTMVTMMIMVTMVTMMTMMISTDLPRW